MSLDDPVIQPLTHCNLEGAVFQRPPEAERQIADALRVDPAEWPARASIADRAAAGYLQEEALVYLLRVAARARNTRLVGDLSEALLRRCASYVHARLWKLGKDAADDGYNDVVQQLFERILDLDTDRGDFFQVRFWLGLERLTTRAFNTLAKEYNRGRQTISISQLAGYNHDDNDDLRTVRAPELDVPSDERFVLIRDALDHVDEPYRTAFLLRHLARWPTEDQDPTVQTISTYFGKTSRTIRNWLERAEEQLQQWRGERDS
jgi:RNA polymerase sigma factor (sigma-70 family)